MRTGAQRAGGFAGRAGVPRRRILHQISAGHGKHEEDSSQNLKRFSPSDALDEHPRKRPEKSRAGGENRYGEAIDQPSVVRKPF